MQTEHQFFRSLFDDAPYPYQSLDSEGRILAVNKAWQQELGFERHEVLGRWFGDFVSANQREEFREQFREILEQGRIVGVVLMLQRRDGSTLNVSFSGRVARDEESRFPRTQCMFFDVSKRSEAEEAFHASDQLRTAFMNLANEGFGLFDDELRLLYINHAGAELFHATPDDLVGRTMSDISPETEHTDRYERFRSVLESGEPFSMEDYASPSAMGERRLALRAFKVGSNLGIILRDVTEEKLAEAKLQESEARWRSIAEDSPDQIMILDANLRITYVNHPLPGLHDAQLVDSPLLQHIDATQQDRVTLALQQVLETREPTVFEFDRTSAEGEVRSYESQAVPRIVTANEVGIIVSARDITQRAQDADRIKALLRRETAMASLSIDFGRATSLRDIYRMTYRQVKASMQADVFVMSRYDATQQLIQAVHVTADGQEQDAATLPVIHLEAEGMGIQSEVIRTGKPLLVPDLRDKLQNTVARYHVAEKATDIKDLEHEQSLAGMTQSAVLVPMRIRDEVIGIMQIQSYRRDAYGAEDVELLSGLASITAVIIENRVLVKQSQSNYEGIIRALAKAIELRDPYTNQHQEGVARIATRIAQALNLPEEQIRAIVLAANIHDIGKVIIPAEILSKPSRLSQAQMSIVQSHVAVAHEVL
ncbi:PAS domain S-box protein, partial [Candidatus Bipolaricaulota bacterium]|nr:PAS domain S-box protein [Candidatus Bipolaricaulota bacterium]